MRLYVIIFDVMQFHVDVMQFMIHYIYGYNLSFCFDYLACNFSVFVVFPSFFLCFKNMKTERTMGSISL